MNYEMMTEGQRNLVNELEQADDPKQVILAGLANRWFAHSGDQMAALHVAFLDWLYDSHELLQWYYDTKEVTDLLREMTPQLLTGTLLFYLYRLGMFNSGDSIDGTMIDRLKAHLNG